MNLRAADPEYYRALCYVPAERRRLARVGSGRHRHAARRVPLARSQHHGFTRAFILEIVAIVAGVAPWRVTFDEWLRGPGTADIVIDGATPREIAAVQAALDPYAPPIISILVRS